MNKLLCSILCILLASFSFAQTCDCESEFLFLKNYMETNHPGLNSDNRKNGNEYKRQTTQILSVIRRKQPKQECILYLQQYMRLLKDHHTSINPQVPSFVRISTQPQLDSFFQTTTFKNDVKRNIDSAMLYYQLKDKKPDEIEGIYKDGSGNLIAFVKEDTKEWPYKGIALSTVRTFTKGTVRYQLQPTTNGKLWAKVLFPDYQLLYHTVALENGAIAELGLAKLGAQASDFDKPKSLCEFKALTSKTNYLRVRSFGAQHFAELDSFYKQIHEQVIGKPFLIIDVRGNGGGAESNYFPLVKYLYTDPIQVDDFSYFVTPEVIRLYKQSIDRMQMDSSRFGSDFIQASRALVERMKKATPYTFMENAKQASITADTVLAYPEKVIILTDKGCASSCEAFIYNAMQSKKVQTLGENTGGFVGFGNTQPLNTPCYNYSVQTTTTKYAHLYKYEFVGIPPTILAKGGTDWIAQAVKQIER